MTIWLGLQGIAGINNIDSEGSGTKDMWRIENGFSGVDDLSYDEEVGNFSIVVICGFNMSPVLGEEQYIQMNRPDGTRKIPYSERYTWNIYGHSGLLFELSCNTNKFSNESDDVYFVGSSWIYNAADMYSDINDGTNGCYLSGDENYYSCSGFGQIIFLPKQLVANNKAFKSNYTFDMNINVDFLAWAIPLEVSGQYYTTQTP